MKVLLTTLGLVFILGMNMTHAQQLSTTTIHLYQDAEFKVPQQMSDWQTYYENAQFKIEYVKSNCDPSSGLDFEAIHMRFTNATNNTLVLNWHIDLDYNGACKTCNSNEYIRTITIPANQSIETGCEMNENREYRLFSKFTDSVYSGGQILTAFKLTDLQVVQ